METTEEQLTQATTALASMQAKVEELENAIVAISDKSEAVTLALAESEGKVAKLTEELAKAGAVNESFQKKEASASEKAAKILASVGVKPVQVATPAGGLKDPKTTKDELWKTYGSIKTPKERNHFYRKHRADML